ncbi:MAG: 30S ribosomal protein S6 [Nannocystis sp.]|nr:30S ribosomal protein S6 [Nannocystis sp.]
MSSTQGQVLSHASRRGTKREYETVIILRSAANKNDILDLVHKGQGVFESYGARLIQIENWGSRTLAYPIDRATTGIYLYWRYLGGSDIVREFERNLRLADKVLRFQTILVDQDVDPVARPSEVTEDLLHAISEPPPEPIVEEPAELSHDDEDDYNDEDGE